MTQTIVIGRGTENLHLEIDDSVQVAPIAGPGSSSGFQEPSESNRSLADRVADALANPQDFLSVTELVVPGDSVAIALEDGLPRPDVIVTGILQALQGSELAKVEVVASASLSAQDHARLRAALPGSVRLTVHDVSDRAALGYLGADDDAQPIRINRSLADADFVLPVNVMRVSDPLLGGPSGDALFPAMIDDAQRDRLQRFTARAIERRENYHDDRAAGQAHQLRWNLGVQLMLSVEVTQGGRAGRIIASSPETLRQSVRAHYSDSRNGTSPSGEPHELAELVIACIEGDAAQQTPENLLRAALVARSHAAAEGTVVVVTTLEQLRFPGAESLADESSENEINGEENAAPGEPSEAGPSHSQAQFAHRLLKELINEIDTSRRYLLYFPGDVEAAEAFGFGFIQDEPALVRLINQHDSCRVVRAAQTAADAGVLSPSEM